MKESKSLLDIALERCGEEKLKEFLYDILGMHITAVWHNVINDIEDCLKADVLNYKERRRLFIDLVRYFMEKGLIRFRSGEVSVGDWNRDYETEEEVPKKYFDFINFTPDQMVEFLEEQMPKGDEKDFDEDSFLLSFFFAHMPFADYWYDGSDPEFPKAEWIESS